MSGVRLASTVAMLGHAVTRHAQVRMQQRALSAAVVRDVLAFGREVQVRGATIYAVGRKEVEHFRRQGVELADAMDVQVVCTSAGVVLTVYRNRDFRGLRPGGASRGGRNRVG